MDVYVQLRNVIEKNFMIFEAGYFTKIFYEKL